MSSWTDAIPVEEISARSGEVRPGRAFMTVFAGVGVAIGWAVGMFLRSIGWLAGRSWMILAFFAETVIYGFREGAGLPQPEPSQASPEPAGRRAS